MLTSFTQGQQVQRQSYKEISRLIDSYSENDRYDFKVSDVVLSKELGLTNKTNKTIKSTKEKLRSFGLIQFETKNGYPSYYRLLLDYPLEISAPEKINKEKSEAENVIQQLEEFVVPTTKISPIEFFNENTIPMKTLK